MKVVHVVNTIDPADGGPPYVVVRLASAQAALGHDAAIVAYRRRGSDERVRESIAAVPSVDKVKIHLVDPPGMRETLTGRRARRVLETVLKGADWVHIHGVWGTILKTAGTVARSFEIPYCVRPAGMLDPWSLRRKALKKRIGLALGYETFLAEAAFVHALNRDEAEHMKALPFLPVVRVLPNGVSFEELSNLPSKGTFEATYPVLVDRTYVLFLGRLHRKKGLDYLVEAFAVLADARSDVELVVAGPDDGVEGWLRERISSLGCRDRIHLVGPLYGRKKLAALVDASVFVLPSLQEGFSVAALEALACGAPVVLSKHCHFPEVEEAGAGVVVDLNKDELAAAMGRILGDRQLASSMGEAGKRLVRERYDWENIAGRMIEQYQE